MQAANGRTHAFPYSKRNRPHSPCPQAQQECHLKPAPLPQSWSEQPRHLFLTAMKIRGKSQHFLERQWNLNFKFLFRSFKLCRANQFILKIFFSFLLFKFYFITAICSLHACGKEGWGEVKRCDQQRNYLFIIFYFFNKFHKNSKF